jgi:NADH pyrophosphatase NudC (nudix superfamily)
MTPQPNPDVPNQKAADAVACSIAKQAVEGEYWRWCPRCGHELHNEKCKLRCPRCHYFMSCSDFD